MKRHAVLAAVCLVSWLARDAPASPHIAVDPVQPPSAAGQVLLVFDLDSMSAGSLQRSKSAVATFIRRGLPEGVAAGVVAGDKLVGSGLTGNRDELIKALDSLRVNTDLLARQGGVPLDRGDERAAEIAATIEAGARSSAEGDLRSRRTLTRLLALTSTLASMPGSKTIVWVSDSFSAPSRDREKVGGHEADVKTIVAAAGQASIRLVGMDARAGTPVLSRDDLWQSLISGTGGQLVGDEKALAAALEATNLAAPDGPDSAAPAVPAPPPAPAAVPPSAGVSVAAAAAATPVAPPAAPPPAPGAGTSPAAKGTPVARLSPASGTRVSGVGEGGGGDAGSLPPELHARVRAGWDAYQAGDTRGARASLTPAASHPAAPPWVHYVLGWAEFAEGNIDSARAQWTSVRDAVPEFQRVYFDLADCSLRQQSPSDALSVLREASKRWPQSAEVLNAIGSIQTTLGRLDEALEAFEHAVASEPRDTAAHFNIARTVELRYFRDSQPVRGSSGKPNPRDLERAVEAYRRVLELNGAESADAAAGLRRTAAIDVTAFNPRVPVLIGSYGDAAIGGFPVRLAWSSDGTYLCIGSLRVDNSGKVVARPVRVVTAWSGELNAAPAMPDWAEAYWAWKAAPAAPWIPGLKIESGRRRSYSMYSRGAPSSVEVLTFQLGRETVGESPPRLGFGAGTTYSWSPYAMGALAYLDKRGVLAVMDSRGRKVDVVGGHGSIMLPAWSPDGVSIAYLEKGSKGFELKTIEVYPKK